MKIFRLALGSLFQCVQCLCPKSWTSHKSQAKKKKKRQKRKSRLFLEDGSCALLHTPQNSIVICHPVRCVRSLLYFVIQDSHVYHGGIFTLTFQSGREQKWWALELEISWCGLDVCRAQGRRRGSLLFLLHTPLSCDTSHHSLSVRQPVKCNK